MVRSFILAALLAGVSAVPVFAETTARPGSQDRRVTYATFSEGQVYRITTALRSVTLVEVGDGETIKSIAIGDLESFKIDRLDAANLFIIKPTLAGASTNVTVETNRHIYFLYVSENSRSTPAFSVKFTVPKSGKSAASSQDVPPEAPMSYAILKKGGRDLPKFAPVRIWDDGKKTFFEFAPGAPIPTVFRADSKGQEYNVNTATVRTTTTASTRSQRWVLRYGDEYVCIEGKEVSYVRG